MVYGTDEFDELIVRVIREEYRHDLYHETCEHAKEMAVHLYSAEPTELLTKVRPREDEEVKQYRIDSYQPTTKAPADKALNIFSKILNPSLSAIRWPDETKSDSSQALEKYALEDYPVYNSLLTYNKDVAMRKMFADPNGIMAVKLKRIPKQTQFTQPIVTIYGSANIWYYDDEHYLIFLKKETINSIEYHYFQYYDGIQYLKLKASVNQKTLTLVEEEKYLHNFGEIPCWHLRGVSEQLDNGDVVYKSFISSALPHWNLHIIHESDLFGAYVSHLHPQKYELSEECGYKWNYEGVEYPCKGGTIRYGAIGSTKSQTMDCPKCDGSGLRSVGPYGVYRYSKEKLSEGNPVGIDPVGYINVPTDATKMLEERSSRMIKMGMWAINMDVEDEVGENQSGIAKVIDRSAQYDTLYNVASVVFDVHLTNQFYFINKYLFQVAAESSKKNVEDNLPQINKPTQFDISSATELVNNFKVAKESGVDRNYQQVKQMEIVAKDFSTNPDLMKKLQVMLDLDPIPLLSPDEAGTVSKFVKDTDITIHFYLKAFVQRAMEENNNFLSLERSEQLALLETYAQEVVEDKKMKLEETMLLMQPNEAEPVSA